MTTLIHLRNRTEHSYKTASGTISKVLDRQQAKIAAITDRHGTWGHVRFAAECKKRGIQPIFGVELAVVFDMDTREKGEHANFMTFLARNNKGLRELYELTTLATEKFYYIPRLDYNYLSEIDKTGNVIILSGSAPNWDFVPKGLKNFYVELNQITPVVIPAMAKKFKYPLVATQDNFYPLPDDKALHEIIMGDRWNSRTAPGHILGYYEWLHLWPEHAKAVTLANKLAAECKAELPTAEMVHPEVKKTLREMCVAGAKRRGVNLKDKAYKERLERELALIADKKFEDYFFVVSDMVTWAKKNMLVGPARGSSCGSLVCYLINITDVDPLPYDLLFERFIDINREDYPDIDIDFPDDRRDLVFDYLRRKYGQENVSRLGTVNVFKPKSAIDAVAKQLKIAAWDINDFKNSVEERWEGDAGANQCIADALEKSDLGKKTLAKFPEIAYAGQIEGHASHTGLHAAGIVVTNKAVTNYCSVNMQTGAVMLDKKDAEKLNLLKIDALGLRTLSVLQDTLDQIGWTKEDLDEQPLNDADAFQILNDRKFAGIFQFEGYALQSLTKQINVSQLEDLISITALARPGPLNSGGAAEFIKRQMNLSPTKYFHPLAKPITEVTYGIIVYQEQVMRIGREIGGMTWSEVSEIRKIIAKSLGNEALEKYWEKFKVGAIKNGISEESARKIWENINTMGSYAFNRSHAVAYGIISYWCCLLKAKFPLEFAAACLRNAKDDTQSIKILRELVKEGYSYKPFDRNLSGINWSVQNGLLVGGLVAIKGVGVKLAEAILRKRDNQIDFTPREERLLAEGETPWDIIFEGGDLWDHIRENPSAYQIESKISNVEDITQDSEGTFVIIAKIAERTQRDANDPENLERRGGQRERGQTKYLNLVLEDDTDTIKALVSRARWADWGLPLTECKIGEWFIFKGENRPPWRKIHIIRWKKLTGNPAYSKCESSKSG